MRIAFIGQKGIPAKSGGVERHVEEIAVRIARAGHDVTVYARKSYGKSKSNPFRNVRIVEIPSIATKNLDAITYSILATSHALFSRYDVVHYQAIGPSSLAWIIRLFKRKTAVLTTFHSKDYEHQKWGWFARTYLKIGEWLTCVASDKTIVIGKSLQRYALKRYGCKAQYIPNGADMRSVKTSESISRWDLKKGRYILTVSRLVKHKGIHFLIEAFKNLEDTNKLPNNFKLVIVGDHAQTQEYVRYLKFISRGRANIVFTGEQTGRTLLELYSNALFFVQPSLSEGLSIALLEAMGCGLMPLVSDIPENLEVAEDAGISFRAGDKDDLASKLAVWLNRPEEVTARGQKACEIIRDGYSWDSIAKKTLETYGKTLHEKHSSQYRTNPQRI